MQDVKASHSPNPRETSAADDAPVRSGRLSLPTVLLGLIMLLLLTGHSWRAFSRVTTPGHFDNFSRGFVDFHNAVYFPTRCFLDGENPYSRKYAAQHPDGRTFPLFPPQSLLIHALFGTMDIATSRAAYWIFELSSAAALLVLIQWITCREVTVRGFFSLGIALMLTIPFYTSLYMGQLTFQLVLGAVVAVHYSRSRPLLAILGLTLAACKPQFGIPLAILLLCRRDWKTAVGGGMLSVLLSGIGVAIICSRFGMESFVEEIKAVYLGLDSHPDVGSALENGWRLDMFPVFARAFTTSGEMPAWTKFLVPAASLAIGGLGVFRLRNNRRAAPLANLIICLTCLGCIYHSIYDAVLLLWPLAGLYFYREEVWHRVSRQTRWIILALLTLILANFFHLEGVQRAFGVFNTDFTVWRILTSIGPMAIFVATLIAVYTGFRIPDNLAISGADSSGT